MKGNGIYAKAERPDHMADKRLKPRRHGIVVILVL
jgi:hypothetical protein